LRDATGELDDLKPALHLAPGVGEHLAVLVGDDGGEVVQPLVDQVAHGEQDGGTPGQ